MLSLASKIGAEEKLPHFIRQSSSYLVMELWSKIMQQLAHAICLFFRKEMGSGNLTKTIIFDQNFQKQLINLREIHLPCIAKILTKWDPLTVLRELIQLA